MDVVFLREPKGKGLLGQPRHEREDNIKINIKERGREFEKYIHLLQYRQQWRTVLNTAAGLWVLEKFGNFFTSIGLNIFPRRSMLHGVRHAITMQEMRFCSGELPLNF